MPVVIFWLAAQPGERSLLEIVGGDRIPWVNADELDRSGLRVSPSSAEDWSRLVRTLRRSTAAEEEIFAFPSHAELYFLADRRNPTKFFSTALGLRNPTDTKRLISDFQSRLPAAVVYDHKDVRSSADESAMLLSWVERHYVRIDSVGSMIVFLPIADEE
jgi:hypothetical protein